MHQKGREGKWMESSANSFGLLQSSTRLSFEVFERVMHLNCKQQSQDETNYQNWL
jgi:hypothetical protein